MPSICKLNVLNVTWTNFHVHGCVGGSFTSTHCAYSLLQGESLIPQCVSVTKKDMSVRADYFQLGNCGLRRGKPWLVGLSLGDVQEGKAMQHGS